MVKWLLIAWALSVIPAQSACRQALLLGLDVSGSVDAREYRLQLDGLAGALISDPVRTAFLSGPDAPVWVAIYEWSGARFQRLVIGWTAVETEADLLAIATTLRTRQRIPAVASTAIGAAMLYGAELFANGPDCWRYTIDLSGDGTNNDGFVPEIVRLRPEFNNVTINGLVIGSDATRGRDERQMEIMELSAYFRRRVIHGPDAFIEVALGFSEYQRAMERKLLRELQGLVVGRL